MQPRPAALFLPLALVSLASCVSQRRYVDLQEEKRVVQLELQDLRAFVGELESENARLEGELAILKGEAVPIEANVHEDIDARLEALKRIERGIAGAELTPLALAGGYGVRLDDAVLFDSGSAELKPEGKELLVQMAELVQRGDYQRIWVRGHTDSDPIVQAETRARFPHGNLELSTARAIAVASELVEHGVDPKRIVVAGFGPNEPVAPNDTPENKRKNRRVELFVLEKDPVASGGASH